MKRTVTSLIAAVLIAGMASPAALAAPSADGKPFVTSARPELVALTGGLTITPILTAGDVVRGAKDRFQFTGVPDGIGVYRSAPGRLEVFINHELSARYGDPSDARISHIALNPAGEVVGAGYVVDGTEGYEWFCSGSMGSVAGTPWYFTGEEWPATKKQGMAIGVNAVTERVHQLRQFGRISHEQVIQVPGMSRAVFFLSEDGRAPRSQIYGYFSDSFAHAVAGQGHVPYLRARSAPRRRPVAGGHRQGRDAARALRHDPARGRPLRCRARCRGAAPPRDGLQSDRGRAAGPRPPRRRLLRGYGLLRSGDTARPHLPPEDGSGPPGARHAPGRPRRRSRRCAAQPRQPRHQRPRAGDPGGP